jgi:hypothetical protein
MEAAGRRRSWAATRRATRGRRTSHGGRASAGGGNRDQRGGTPAASCQLSCVRVMTVTPGGEGPGCSVQGPAGQARRGQAPVGQAGKYVLDELWGGGCPF